MNKIKEGDLINIPSKKIFNASISEVFTSGAVGVDYFEPAEGYGPYSHHWSGPGRPEEIIKISDAQNPSVGDIITARHHAPDPIRCSTDHKCRMAVILRVHADGACTVGIIDDGPFFQGARRPQLFMRTDEMKGMVKVSIASIQDFPSEYGYYFCANPIAVDWKNSIIQLRRSS